MTPLGRWFRDIREKIFGNFYEGPEPPERLEKIAIVFSQMYPNATKHDWARFAIEHARESYRSGYVRGYEYVERDPDERALMQSADPDLMADALDPDWRWSPEVQLSDLPNEPVSEFIQSEAEELEDLLRELNAADDENSKR